MTSKEQTNTTLTAKERAKQILEQRNGRRAMDGINSRFPQLPPRQGFKTHWFKDEKGRVERALQDGWTFSERPGYTDDKIDLVKNPKKRIHIRSGSREDLSDQFSYAMDIPLEVYEMDRRAKLEVVERKEKYIKEGKTEDIGSLGVETGAKVTTNIQTNFKPD